MTFFKIGAFTFGGGLAMIPLIRREVVENRQWLTDEDFMDTIAVTQSAPGPIAVNSATFIGYKLAGIPGALTALSGTVLPSFLVILLIAVFLENLGQSFLLQKFFSGVRPAVIALILTAGIRMGRKALRNTTDYLEAVIAFLLLIIADFHPIILIILGALWGASRVHHAAKQGGNKQ